MIIAFHFKQPHAQVSLYHVIEAVKKILKRHPIKLQKFGIENLTQKVSLFIDFRFLDVEHPLSIETVRRFLLRKKKQLTIGDGT